MSSNDYVLNMDDNDCNDDDCNEDYDNYTDCNTYYDENDQENNDCDNDNGDGNSDNDNNDDGDDAGSCHDTAYHSGSNVNSDGPCIDQNESNFSQQNVNKDWQKGANYKNKKGKGKFNNNNNQNNNNNKGNQKNSKNQNNNNNQKSNKSTLPTSSNNNRNNNNMYLGFVKYEGNSKGYNNNNNNNKSNFNGNNNQSNNNNNNKNNNNKYNNNNNKNNNNNNKNNNNNNKNNNNNNSNNNKNNGDSNNMSVRANYQSRLDFVKYIFDTFKTFAKEKKYQPFNSWVLRLHYRMTMLFFFFVGLIAWRNWYVKEEIVCVTSYNVEKPPPGYIINMCLSYSYHNMAVGGEKVYVLYYRWINYALFFLAMMFYMPRIFMKQFGNPRVKALIQELQIISKSYENSRYNRLKENIVDYLRENLGTHIDTYFLFVVNHIFCCLITTFAFYFLDFVLQGKFLTLPLETLPFVRDPENFRDSLSLVFPPFVTCCISESSHMLSEREEILYCHLTLMELYEKAFVLGWVFLSLVWIVGMLAVFVLFLLPLPCFAQFLLATALSSPYLRESKRILMRKLDFGDIFVIYLMKCHVSEAQICELIVDVRGIIEARKEMEKKVHGIEKFSCGFSDFATCFQCNPKQPMYNPDMVPPGDYPPSHGIFKAAEEPPMGGNAGREMELVMRR